MIINQQNLRNLFIGYRAAFKMPSRVFSPTSTSSC